MNDVKSCLLVGVGGQGAILISKIMSNGFMKAGYDVKQSEVHGMAQRGGSVSTQVRWGKKVYGPVFGKGEADIMVALEKMEAVRYAEFLNPDKCKSCKSCLKVGCPAISMENGKAFIDRTQCVGCTVCAQACPFDAIEKEEK